MADLVSCNDLGQPWHILSRFWLMGRTHFQGLFGHYPLIWPQANPLSPPVVKKLPFSTAKKFLLSFFLGRALKAVEGGPADFAFARACKHSTSANANQSPFNIQNFELYLSHFEMYFAKFWNVFLYKKALLILYLRARAKNQLLQTPINHLHPSLSSSSSSHSTYPSKSSSAAAAVAAVADVK